MKNYSFNVSTPTLKISANSNITVSPSKAGSIKIEVDGSDKAIESITVKQSGDTIEIQDKSSGGSSQTIISNGRTVVQSVSGDVVMGNISMVNGDVHIGGGSGSVFVNGKRIDLDGDRNDSKEDYKPTLIAIYTPIADLDLTLKGFAKFAASQHFDSVYADLSGTTQKR
jgi:hypothetical protein